MVRPPIRNGLQLATYKTQLEVVKLETELGIPESAITLQLPVQQENSTTYHNL